MPPFSLIVSVTPPADLDPERLVHALIADDRVRGATARTPPTDPSARLDVFLSVLAETAEDAADSSVALVRSLLPEDPTVGVLGDAAFGFAGHS